MLSDATTHSVKLFTSFAEASTRLSMEIKLEAKHTGCRFCDYSRRQRSVDGIDNPWIESDEHFAMVSKGAFVPGWTVACPKLHQLNLKNEFGSRPFWNFVSTVAKIVGERYGTIQVFEHGPAVANSTMGCGTDHAHLHVVSLPFSLADEVLRFEPSLEWVHCNVSDIANRVDGHEYLFVSTRFDGENTSGMLCLPALATSQFFRRVIAAHLGIGGEFDYRLHPMLEIANESAERLRADVIERKYIRAG